MIQMKKYITIVVSLFVLMSTIDAQPSEVDYPCYRITVDEGLESMQRKEYGQAIQQFVTAFSCNYTLGKDSLELLIEQSTNALNQAIKIAEEAKELEKEQKEKETLLKDQAVQDRNEKEKALQEKDKALQGKAAALEEARKQGMRAESMLLQHLAEDAGLQGNYEKALVMAFAGLQLSKKGSATENGMTAFGGAVKDALSDTIYKNSTPIEELAILSASKKLMAISNKKIELINHHSSNDKNTHSFKARKSEVSNYTISTKNNQLVCWQDNNVQLWSAEGELIKAYSDHSDEILAACFSNDDRFLLTCSRDNSAIIRNLEDNVIYELKGHKSPVYDAKFSFNNRYVLTRSSDGLVIVWDINGNKLSSLGGNEIYIYDADINVAGDKVVTAAANGMIKIWNIDGNKSIVLNQKGPAVKEVHFFSTSDHIISRSTKKIELWNMSGESLSREIGPNAFKGLCINHKESAILLWGKKRALRLIDQNGGFIQEFRGLDAEVVKAVFSPNDQFFLTTSKDNSVVLWDINGDLLIRWPSFDQFPASACFSEDGEYVLITSTKGQRIMKCPLPKNVKKQMELDIENWYESIRAIGTDYQLEFLDELWK